MAACSSWTGQRALQALPSKSFSDKRGVSHYSLSENLTNSNDGVAVYKVSKTGKLQPRKVAFTADKRNLLVTTRRFKFGLQGLWNKAASAAARIHRKGSQDAADGGADTNNICDTPTSAGGGGVHSNSQPAKVIPLEAIDRVQRGATSHRFLLARKEALAENERHGGGGAGQTSSSSGGNNSNQNNNFSKKVLNWIDGEDDGIGSACFTIVYAVAGSGSSSSGGVGSSSSSHQNESGVGGGFGGLQQHFETLDLVVPVSKDYESLLTSLEDLVALYQEERQRYSSFLQLLQHHWCVTFGKQLQSPLTHSEFLTLCEKLQVPVKRGVLSIMFKEELALHERKDDCMPLEHVAQLLENVQKSSLPKENLSLEKLWQELRETDPVPPAEISRNPNQHGMRSARNRDEGGGTANDNDKSFEHDATMGDDGRDKERDTSLADRPDTSEDNDGSLELNAVDGENEEETISAVAFLSFLRSQQKEFSTTLEEATDLVHVLNEHRAMPNDLALDAGAGGGHRKTNADKTDRLTKSRFLSFLTSDANDLLNPSNGKPGTDDMSLPLSHYWINTSHDTYMDMLPNSSLNGKSAYQKVKKPSDLNAVNEQCYAAALLRGVRCLELDLWDGLDGREPVIAKQKPQTPSDKRLPVAIVLKIIRQFLQQHPYTFPILLKLENHCCTLVQQRLAQLLYTHLGKDNYIATPSLQHYDLDASVALPSPDILRGKVVIIGKRPKKVISGRNVRKDDFDVDNDKFSDKGKYLDVDEDEDKEQYGRIVGFNTKGPVRSHDADALERSPDELLFMAEEEADRAHKAAQESHAQTSQLEREAQQYEKRAAHWAQRSGLTRGEIQRRAACFSQGTSLVDIVNDRNLAENSVDNGYLNGEEKSTKEEGLEVHEVLPGFLEGNKEKYQQAAQDAMECAGREAQAHTALQEKEEALRMAIANLEMSRKRESTVADSAKRAAAEARSHFEHAESARERVEQVRELLQSSRDQSSSAGTVVQTALTEAKISEKRAADAEARAARAAQSAEKDRIRADDETKKEESLEQEVNSLHSRCVTATESAKAARERVEKAAAMLDRVNEDIRVIETSSQYRTESQEGGRNGGDFVAKHAAKIEEREMCRELIREASEEHAAAESSRNRFQQQFEERAYQWKVQADIASQQRRAADRSAHVAEELAEHAEEEREAADLRHTARQRAEATVENRDSYRSSIEAQLAEAERAAAEASKLAVQSRKRADHLLKEMERVKDHSRFEQMVEKLEWEKKEAQGEYDAAKMDREEKDRVMTEEKRRLDTNAEVYQTAAREAAAETDRVKVEHLYQQEAVKAFIEAKQALEKAKASLEHSKSSTYKAEVKRLAAERAKEYKKKMEMTVEIPIDLARITLIHTLKHQNWAKSLALSNVQAHSFAQNVLLRMVDKDLEEEKRNLHAFTKNHLVRVFPSWKALQNKSVTNYDPVFAWSLGCQLVASNFHSTDESLLIAEGRFRQNGSCGYVLKPAYLLDNITKIEDDQRWSFHIMSGHHLPKPIRKAAGATSPLVKISIYSGSAKETRISYRTRPARQAGLNPVWTSNNKFEFIIPTPSVSMICFSVWHAMDDGTENFMAASAFPASCLREGYRSIVLFHENHSRAISSCLLVKATKR